MGLLSTIGAASARAYGFTRSAVSAAVDAYFNRVTLLLNTSSTNGAQNNTFLDSSSNNFSITRNPTSGPNAPTQGTFTPFSQTGWGNYFNGTTDSLNAPAGSPFAFGTGAWTVEAWVYVTTLQDILLFDTRSSASNSGVGCLITSTGTLSYSGSANNALTSSAITANSWNHVAWSYDGTTLSGYINGSRGGTAMPAFNITQNNGFIGRVAFVASAYMNGYISNLRVVKGAAVYSGASFTVPTLPLGATSGGQNPPTGTQTSLLTCQSNRFIDNGGLATPNTITVNGTPRVQAFSPFAPTAAYDTTTVGGSGYFDGTGDYLSLASNTAFNIFGGDMTVEFWFYQTATTNTSQHLLAFVETSTSRVSIYFSAANTLSFWSNGGTTGAVRISATSIVPNNWYHYALVKSGSTFTMYINGVSVGTSTTTAYSTANQLLRIATYDGTTANDNFMGYISNIRIIKGQALTSGAFTPPTAPVTTSAVGWTGANVASSITGTVSLLASFTNAGIYDSASKNLLETVANAQVSTTQAKWGTTSMYFDGTTNTRLIPSTSDLGAFGTGDFTIEFWIRFTAVNTAQIIIDFRSAVSSVAPVIGLKNTGVIYYYTGGTSPGERITGSTLSANTWYYVAVTRASGTTKMFVDGSQVGSSYADSNSYVGIAGRPWVGNLADGTTPAQNLTAYIDDLRITRGYARTISSSPTAAFPLQ